MKLELLLVQNVRGDRKFVSFVKPAGSQVNNRTDVDCVFHVEFGLLVGIETDFRFRKVRYGKSSIQMIIVPDHNTGGKVQHAHVISLDVAVV